MRVHRAALARAVDEPVACLRTPCQTCDRHPVRGPARGRCPPGKTFILDTLGAGIAGSTAAGAEELWKTCASWGSGAEACVWGLGKRVPAPTATFLNGFQTHSQEYDCVHEKAVLHPMATLLPGALAYAERKGGVSGRDLIVAVAVGVDVAANLGVSAREGLKFFRPATSGGFGATAAIARLAGFDVEMLCNAFGIQYAQASGTMQSHVEGSIVLPMQVGFNGRAALHSCDIAASGLSGPRDVFEGQFGYMRLFEGTWDLQPTWDSLGKTWLVSELSHKPFPAGRATHGGIEGIMALREQHKFRPEDVAAVNVIGPPLIKRLCGRPDIPAPNANYARLCMAFIGAKVLLHGKIDVAHYRGAELTDPATHELAKRITMTADGNPDPNALVPQEVVITLKNGERAALELRRHAGQSGAPFYARAAPHEIPPVPRVRSRAAAPRHGRNADRSGRSA